MRSAIAAAIVLALSATSEAGQTRRYFTPPQSGPSHIHLHRHGFGYCYPRMWNRPVISRGIGPTLTPPAFRSIGPYQPYQIGPSVTKSRTYVHAAPSTYTGKPLLIINPYVDQTGFEKLGVSN